MKTFKIETAIILGALMLFVGCNSNNSDRYNVQNSGDSQVPDYCEGFLLESRHYIGYDNMTLDAKIKQFPSCICDMDTLRSLRIVDSEIQLLPVCIGQMINLEELILSRTSIKYLPKSFGNLESLRKLSIHESPLTNIPKSIGQLNMLEELYLSDLPINEIPSDIVEIKSLRELGCWNTDIETLPSELFSLDSLRVFEYSGSLVDYINTKLTKEQQQWIKNRAPPALEHIDTPL